MIVKVVLSGTKECFPTVEIELDTARDAARIEDEARKLNILDKDRVTSDVVFKLIGRLANNLLKDVEDELNEKE